MKSIKSILLLVLFIAAGCGANGNNAQETQDAEQGSRVKVQNTVNEADADRQKSVDKANYLAQLAGKVPDVNGATAIVIGDFAVVGIDVNKDLERSEVGSIKYSVNEALMHDPNGARALVVADPDLRARIAEVAEDFRNGAPIQGIMNELADITGRIIPTTPADNLNPQPPSSTEKPKETLDQQQEKELDDTQNRQSNYQKEN